MIIAKVYENQFDTTPSYLLDEINELDIEQEVSGDSRVTMAIPVFSWLKQYQKIELYEVKNGTDNIFFSGYIYALRLSIEKFELDLRDENTLMRHKWVLSDKSYTDKAPEHILNDIVTERNASYSESWTVDSSVTDTITVDFKKGDNWYAVLDTLSEQLGYNWMVRQQTITFDDIVGVDRTSWDNFIELVYNWDNHREDNIANVTRESYGNVSNVILGSDFDNKILKSDGTSISKRWALFEQKSFNGWDLNEQTQNYLDFKKSDLFNYKIETEPFWPDVGLWDKIHLRVENLNEYLNYDGDVLVSGVELEYINATLVKIIKVEIQVVKNNYLRNRLEKIEDNLNLLNLY